MISNVVVGDVVFMPTFPDSWIYIAFDKDTIPENSTSVSVKSQVYPDDAMVRLLSKVIALTNSSKSREFDVTNLFPEGNTGTLLNVQVPVIVSSAALDAGPVV